MTARLYQPSSLTQLRDIARFLYHTRSSGFSEPSYPVTHPIGDCTRRTQAQNDWLTICFENKNKIWGFHFVIPLDAHPQTLSLECLSYYWHTAPSYAARNSNGQRFSLIKFQPMYQVNFHGDTTKGWMTKTFCGIPNIFHSVHLSFQIAPVYPPMPVEQENMAASYYST